MNRNDLQRLAHVRIREAKVLLGAKHPSGAYYLAGYSVECALKACIARKTRRFDFPEKARVLQSYSHSLRELLRVAELDGVMVTDSGSIPALGQNWKAAQEWDEASRYEEWTQAEAKAMLTAISGENGVLPWLARHW
jgi:HEPN domain-containing protein